MPRKNVVFFVVFAAFLIAVLIWLTAALPPKATADTQSMVKSQNIGPAAFSPIPHPTPGPAIPVSAQATKPLSGKSLAPSTEDS